MLLTGQHLVKEEIHLFQHEINFSGSKWLNKLEVISIDDLMDIYYEKYTITHTFFCCFSHLSLQSFFCSVAYYY